MLASAYPILSFSNLELEGKWQEEGVTARSSLIMGWFPCAAAVLGSPNAQGKPAQHIHLPLGGRTAPGKARSGRRFDFMDLCRQSDVSAFQYAI